MNSERLLNLGWKPKVKLIDGLENTYKDYLKVNENT